jgi:hypothetical protein
MTRRTQTDRQALVARAEQWLERWRVKDGREPEYDEGDCLVCGASAGEPHEPTDHCGIIADLLALLRADDEAEPQGNCSTCRWWDEHKNAAGQSMHEGRCFQGVRVGNPTRQSPDGGLYTHASFRCSEFTAIGDAPAPSRPAGGAAPGKSGA